MSVHQSGRQREGLDKAKQQETQRTRAEALQSPGLTNHCQSIREREKTSIRQNNKKLKRQVENQGAEIESEWSLNPLDSLDIWCRVRRGAAVRPRGRHEALSGEVSPGLNDRAAVH